MEKGQINKKNIRYFNKIEIADNGNSIIKSYIGDDVNFRNKFINEIIWMLKAQKLIPNHVPKIIKYSLENNDLWMKYKIINDQNIHDIFLNNKLKNNTFWMSFAKESVNFFNVLRTIQPRVFLKEEWKNNVYFFSIKRQLEVIHKLEQDNKFHIFYKKDFIYINDKRYPSLSRIKKFLEKKSEELENNKNIDKNDVFWILSNPSIERICFTHLDLVFGNIFFNKDTKSLKVIDPRGSYYNNSDYGDIYYDYAKYYQSIYGLYDFVAEDKFDIIISEKDLKINHKIELPKNYSSIKKAFVPFFEDVNIEVIKLIEAFQFITMVPAHIDNYRRQILELCIGIQHFYEVIGNVIWK